MASYSRREITIRHIEYTIPKYGADGAPIAEVYKALAAAEQEWDTLHPGERADGGWCRVDADDEHVIIRIEVRNG